MEVVTKTKNIQHPMEDVLDLDPGTTLVEYNEVIPSVPVAMPDYDVKDDEIETKLEEIYTVAMGNVEAVADELDRVEGKYKARIGEVTAAMLNVALGAVREKRELKKHKDGIAPTSGDGNPRTVNNNLIVADRNEILRFLQKKGEGK